MARTKTSSIIKTCSQSRTGKTAPVAATGRTTGTNDRTIDVTPTPVVTTTDPVPVAVATGRTTLKDPLLFLLLLE